MAFCLPQEATKKFLSALKDGSIDPAKLANMTSEERRTFFEKIVGKDDAKEVNAQLESKLILADQKRGMVSWAKKISGITEATRTDMIAKIGRMDKVLDAESEAKFLEDLAGKKLGTEVTFEEAQKISELSKKVDETKKEADAGGDRLAWGRAKVALMNYVNDLKLGKQISFKDAMTNPIQTAKDIITSPVESVSKLAGQAKAIKASMDDSAIFRQGWRSMITNPSIWAKNALGSFKNIWDQFGGKNVMDEVNAEILSRPTYDKMVKGGLDVGNLEEAFPTTLPEKIPLFGRFYKASEVGFTAFIRQLRADIFDKYLDIAEKTGYDMSKKEELQGVANLVNSLTGRGKMGAAEKVAGAVNNVFFSPRFLKSQIDTLTTPFKVDVAGEKVTSFQQKQAAINLAKIIMAQATIMTIANILQPGSAETDPRSSDFGKIKVGSTRFDVSGGAGSLITFLSREIMGQTKNTSTGAINSLTSGKFGAPTRMDQVYNFFENKLSPATSVVKDLLKGKDFNGNKPTLLNEAGNLAVPFPIQNLYTNNDPKAANILLIMMADSLGINANTYSSPVKKIGL